MKHIGTLLFSLALALALTLGAGAEAAPEENSATPDMAAPGDYAVYEAPPTGLGELYGLDEGFSEPILAKVVSIVEDDGIAADLFPQKSEETRVFEARLLRGPYAGTSVLCTQTMGPTTARFLRPVAVEDRVFLTLYRDDAGAIRASFSDFYRTPVLLIAGVLAAAALIVVCKRKAGLKLVFAVGLSLCTVLFVLVPLLLGGMQPLLAGALCCALILILCVWILYGIKYHTLAALLGALCALLAAGALVGLTDWLLRLSGIASLDMLRRYYSGGAAIDLGGALCTLVMLSSVGAILVVCRTAALGAEPREGQPRDFKSVFGAGMRAGGGAISPVVTTLAFSSIGWAAGFILLLRMGGMPYERIISDERVSTELLRLFAGLCGLLLCVPLTSLFAALLMRVRQKEDGSLCEFRVKEALIEREHQIFGRIAERLDRSAKAMTKAATPEPRAAQAQNEGANEPAGEEEPAAAAAGDGQSDGAHEQAPQEADVQKGGARPNEGKGEKPARRHKK